MNNIECEYCNKKFSTKSNLIYHQKTAKYCLLIQSGMENLSSKQNTCEFCKEFFTRKSTLTNHLTICKSKRELEQQNINEKYQKEIEKIINSYDLQIANIKELQEKHIQKIQQDYQLQIEELKKQNEILLNKNQELALKAIEKQNVSYNYNQHTKNDNSISNIYNHLQPLNLSPEYLYQVLDQNLKLEHIYQGQKGLADLVADKILTDENGKPLAYCNDKSRQIIKYKNEGGNIVKDIRAYNLVNSIAPVAEEIAIKRRREFENVYYPKKNKEEEEEEEFFGFEDSDDEEFNAYLERIKKEKDLKKQKEGVENIIQHIQYHDDWDDEKKNYYYQKLMSGIMDLQILNVNPTLFSKQLSMRLPSEEKINTPKNNLKTI